MESPPPYNLLLYSAKVVVGCLKEVGEHQAVLVGGMAVNLHGIRTKTLDLDIVILNPSTTEANIQKALVNRFPERFFLEPSAQPRKRYKLLFYRVPGRISPRYEGNRNVKVDILLPTVPAVKVHYVGLARNRFESAKGLQIAPIHFILFHKLVGWDIRVDHEHRSKQNKAVNRDKPVIIQLCEFASKHSIQPLSTVNMSPAYRKKFAALASKFVERYQGTASDFRKIGFEL